MTPILYLNWIRIEKAKDLLENTDTSISEISELIGFQSIHYFSRYFKKKENCTPTEYRIRHSQNKYYSF
jgi:AraC-like DNA-binding protein